MSFKKIVFTVGVTGITLLLLAIFILPLRLPMSLNLASLPTNIISLFNQPGVGLPVRLEIPKIKLDTALEYVSLTSAGALGVPKDISHAAWFSLGPRPGQEGSAIIDGHYGWKNGQPAVFNNLYTLEVGDKIYIEDKTGTTTTFVVRKIQAYGKDEDVSGVFGLDDGKAHLNLITCEGVWIPAEKTYSNRLIIFADKV